MNIVSPFQGLKYPLTQAGGEKEVVVNTQILTATNKDILKQVKTGKFRSDLFFRLNVFTVTIPTLRDKRRDLPIFADLIIRLYSKKLGLSKAPQIDDSTIKR